MFVIRGREGQIVTSTAMDETFGEEIQHETRDEAEAALRELEISLPKGLFSVVELNKVGRPSLGITKKISVTLSEENWEWLDEKAAGNRSKFVRQTILNSLGNESEWDNYACLGYAIKGAEKLGYSQDEIQKLVNAIYSGFDMTSVPEANKVYRESEY